MRLNARRWASTFSHNSSGDCASGDRQAIPTIAIAGIIAHASLNTLEWQISLEVHSPGANATPCSCLVSSPVCHSAVFFSLWQGHHLVGVNKGIVNLIFFGQMDLPDEGAVA